MAATATNSSQTETPVNLRTVREGDEEVQTINVEHEPSRDQIFGHFGVDSADELAEQFTTAGRRYIDVRLGVLRGTGEDTTFHAETELLDQVDGVDEALAAALIEWFDDIPSLCEELRRDPNGALGTVLNDARVEEREWTEELAAFIEELNEAGTNFEQRLKDVGVWVEPQNATGGH